MAGACYGFAVSQIGLLTVPVGMLLTAWLVRARRTGRELLGLAAGVGAVSVLVGGLNLDYRPCPTDGVVLAYGQTEFSCGGFDGLPWLIVGVMAVVVAGVAYALLGRSPADV